MDNTTMKSPITLAAILIVIVGMFHVLSGIAAITATDSVATKEVNDVLYEINIESWGWLWLITGVAQLLTSILLFSRRPIGGMIALLGASVTALFTIFVIFYAPLWAITVLSMDVAIIWLISQNFDELID